MKHLPVPQYSLCACPWSVPAVRGPVSTVTPQQCHGLSK